MSLASADELPDAGAAATPDAGDPAQAGAQKQGDDHDQDLPDDHATAAVPAADQRPTQKAKKAKKAKKKRSKKHGKLEFGGRVFVRAAAVKVKTAPKFVGQQTLNSARGKAKYRWHEVRAELQVELATKVKIKNAFAELRVADAAAKVDVRAGNFKMPFSAIQMTSLWTLPMADRGLLDNVLVKRLQVAGRAIGGMVIVELPGAWSPELRAGVFQGVDDAGVPITAPAKDRFGQDGSIRLSAEPAHGLELGISGQARVGELQVVPVVVSRGYAGEVDATLSTAAGPGLLRIWGEGMLGTSWLVVAGDPRHTRATFTEGRGIAAYRLGGADHGHRYVELYGLFGALDPDHSIRHDLVIEATGGITYGASNVWRLQAEFERWQVGSNAPIGIVELGIGPSTSTTVLVQLGARI